MHVKELQSKKAQSQLSPTENTAPALPEEPGLELSIFLP